MLEGEGSFLQAAKLYIQAAPEGPAGLWTEYRAARALYHAGQHDDHASQLCRKINQQRPTPASLLLAARLLGRSGRNEEALELLLQAQDALKWKGRECNSPLKTSTPAKIP